jgi:uncharacterized lipoprotein YmbA
MFRHFFIASLVIVLSACGSSPKTSFYTLSAAPPSDTHSDQMADGVRVGIWRAKIPALLDRSEIVTRSGEHTIELADFHKWADRIDNSISRLVANELGRRLRTDHIVVSPWSSYTKNDYQVIMNIDRFDGELGGEIVFSGSWSLLNGEGNKELAREVFTYKEQAAGATYSDMIAALSKLTVQLATQIANVIAAR